MSIFYITKSETTQVSRSVLRVFGFVTQLRCVSCFGSVVAGCNMNIMCESWVRNVQVGGGVFPSHITVPVRVHAIADVSTVHLSTGMALMCYSETHSSLYWKKEKSGLKSLGAPQAACCCADGGECVYTLLSHEKVAVFDVGLMGDSNLSETDWIKNKRRVWLRIKCEIHRVDQCLWSVACSDSCRGSAAHTLNCWLMDTKWCCSLTCLLGICWVQMAEQPFFLEHCFMSCLLYCALKNQTHDDLSLKWEDN